MILGCTLQPKSYLKYKYLNKEKVSKTINKKPAKINN